MKANYETSLSCNCSLLFCAVFLSATSPTLLKAAGFSNFTQGAGPMGVANASVAHSEGLTSVYYNPALQLDFEGVNLDFGLTLVTPEKKLNSSVTMRKYESESATYTPVHLAAGYRMFDRLSLALTINNSFGLGSEFPEDTVFRYMTTSSELTTWDVNPSVAYRLHENVNLAFGLRAVCADVSLKQMVPLSSLGLPDARQTLEADGTGYGWNIGVSFTPVTDWTIGLSYRSKVDIDLSGNLHYDFPVQGSPLLQSIFPATSASSDFTLPAQFFGGIAYKPNEKWVIEGAVRYEQYSSYDALTVVTEQPIRGRTMLTIPKNWKDVWGYMLGASYQGDSGYRFSAGYLYEENPVPDETFEPGVSGLDKHTITVGVAKSFSKFTCRVSLAYDFYQDRDIENSTYILNGTHSQDNYSLAFSFGWKF